MNSFIILPIIFSALLAFIATPVVIVFAKRFNLIDDPKLNNHPKVIHSTPIPRGGGLAIFIAILIASCFYLSIDKKLIGILLGGLILTITGILDDKYNLNPYLRLFIGFTAALFPIMSGIGIAFVSNPLGGIIDLSYPRITFEFFGQHSIWLLADLFALFWVTFLMNMVNMGAKGVDGQLSGVAVISALTIMFTSLKFFEDSSQESVIILSAILAGAYLGFLPWHIHPQKIMPGYSGSTLAGYMLGVLSILSTTKVGVLLVVLGVPLIDTVYTIIRRIIHKKSPVWGDRGHLHHRLLDSGLTKSQVAIFYWVTTAILGLLAINLNTLPKLYTMIGVTVFVGGLILLLKTKNS